MKAKTKKLNSNLHLAKKLKNDEFYTRYEDIEIEIEHYVQQNKDVFSDKVILLPCDNYEWSNFTKYFNDNFERFGIKKLISTCYTEPKYNLFDEFLNPNFDGDLEAFKGKIFVRDNKGISKGYLDGDGDFRSKEIGMYRDEADVIITNPPFSLFREFIKWIGDKHFLIIGNINAITYKEVFPLIKENKIWLGATGFNGMYYKVPDNFVYTEKYKMKKEIDGVKVCFVPGTCWFTNIQHARRNEKLMLLTKKESERFFIKGGFQKYDNYDAIEVPKTKAIPSDYSGVMGVPITFLDKYNPEQFEIVSSNDYRKNDKVPFKAHGLIKDKDGTINGKAVYARILIKHKNPLESERFFVKGGFQKYDNYDAIEVPKTKAIPSDYSGVMGVPITFLDKYNPEQFEIIGKMSTNVIDKYNFGYPYVNKKKVYARILIKHKNPLKS